MDSRVCYSNPYQVPSWIDPPSMHAGVLRLQRRRRGEDQSSQRRSASPQEAS